jgi:hypothetical protein
MRVMRVMRVMTSARNCHTLMHAKRVALLMMSRTVDGIFSATRMPRVCLMSRTLTLFSYILYVFPTDRVSDAVQSVFTPFPWLLLSIL